VGVDGDGSLKEIAEDSPGPLVESCDVAVAVAAVAVAVAVAGPETELVVAVGGRGNSESWGGSKRWSALAEETSPDDVVGRESEGGSKKPVPGRVSVSLQSSMTERRRDCGRESEP